MKIVAHLERFIGKISEVIEIVDRKHKISISLFENVPFEGVRTYCTLGLNKFFLDYYYEFVFVCGSNFNQNEIASFLTSFSEFLIEEKTSVLQGDILSFDFTLTSETKMNSLYFTLPFYFDHDFQDLHLEDRAVIFPLIVPVYHQEALLIREKGWNSFEDFLEENDVDNLWDLNRDPLHW